MMPGPRFTATPNTVCDCCFAFSLQVLLQCSGYWFGWFLVLVCVWGRHVADRHFINIIINKFSISIAITNTMSAINTTSAINANSFPSLHRSYCWRVPRLSLSVYVSGCTWREGHHGGNNLGEGCVNIVDVDKGLLRRETNKHALDWNCSLSDRCNGTKY